MRRLGGALPEPPPELWQPLRAVLIEAGHAQMAVAFSGGPDSLALAATLAWLAEQSEVGAVPAELWHVHHGLMVQADSWAEQAEQWAVALHMPLRLARVAVSPALQQEQGLEAAARQARYQAFQAWALAAGCQHLLLAHHQDDQAETVLFRLLRGAGPGGLAAMRSRLPSGALTLWRPWLQVPRALMLPYAECVAQAAGIALAQDPSNLALHHARGWLRRQVMPRIAQQWPGYRQVLARHAQQAAELQDWLQDLVAEDLARLQCHGQMLDVVGWQQLPATRARLVLRAWLQAQGLGLPSAARLQALERQLQQAGPDRQLRWQHQGMVFGVYRQRLQRVPLPLLQLPPDSLQRWQQEPVWVLPAGLGFLRFTWAEQGICPAWLAAAPLRMSWQAEGGRLRLMPGQPSRTLKAWFQQLAIAPWWRERALRLWHGNTLVFVAGLGQAADVPQASPGVCLHWVGAEQPDDKPPENAG